MTEIESQVRQLYGELGMDIMAMLLTGWSPNRVEAILRSGPAGMPDQLLKHLVNYAVNKVSFLQQHKQQTEGKQ